MIRRTRTRNVIAIISVLAAALFAAAAGSRIFGDTNAPLAAHVVSAPSYVTCNTPVGCLTDAQITNLHTNPIPVTPAMQAVIEHKAPPPAGPSNLPPSGTARLTGSLQGNYYFCSQPDDSGCYNDWGGGGSGTLVRYYQCPACGGNGMFNEWYYGPVTRTYPLNSQGFYDDFHDNSVLQWCNAPFGQGQNPSRCLDQGRGVNSQLQIETTQNNTVQRFVWDGDNRHVAVAASAPSFLSGTNHPVWTGPSNGDTGNGAYVWMVGSSASQWHAIGTGY